MYGYYSFYGVYREVLGVGGEQGLMNFTIFDC